ncbi:MAG: acyl-CoA dehydrogenase family protein [Solirubrobacterales bacterium]|nr:acyl-CoA dehydrogenase family protein [Solirubrobacterales bacterium]MBV9165723.1 acyl-CoA dehydrogenase family protein [Solirubrobacterales bacterium]MBV9536729.1 acyl-CoA dehydrogenase family protein [Solirubrobacterales bacterium]
MAAGLRALNRLASSSFVDRLGLREPAEWFLHGAAKTTVRTAANAGRTFQATRKLTAAARQPRAAAGSLFDLTPTDEQQMLRDAVRSFALERVRPAAEQADAGAAVPLELLSQANELGLSMVGVPEELGGALAERSAVTSVLMTEALAQGDMGFAVACMAPAGVSTALGLWGDAEQQATYLHEFLSHEVPAAAVCVLEPEPLFDPARLTTAARRIPGGFVLDGVKALVPRAADAELFIVAAALEDRGPALFIVESTTPGIAVEPEPAMGIRAAATGRVSFEQLKLPARALLGEASREIYTECIALGRLGWCALAVGTGQAVLDYVIPYVNERRAFGEPISHRQAVAFTVSNIAIECNGMRLATYRAASRADQGKSFLRETALARRLCSEHGMAIGSDGVQLLGGHGYVKEHPVERWYRDLRAAGLMEGALVP